jgi:hypothetical protein
MNIRLPHVIPLISLAAALVSGLVEFIALQRGRLRDRSPR